MKTKLFTLLFAVAVSVTNLFAASVVLPATLDVTNVSFRSEDMPDFVIEDGTYLDMGAHDSANDTLLYAEWDVTIQSIKYDVAVNVYNTNSWSVQLYVLNMVGDTVKDLRYKGTSGMKGRVAIGSWDLSDLEAGNYKVRVHAATAWSAMKLKEVIFDGTVASGTCGAQGDNLTWVLTSDSVLTISGSGAMEDCNWNNNAPWYDNRNYIRTVVVEQGVTSIGEFAFSGCTGLTSVTIPNSVTSIGDFAFYECSSLTSIDIPNSVTSIGSEAFKYCSSLPSVTIPNSVTSIGDFAFYECSSLTSIIIPNSVTNIGDYAFGVCSGLTSIIVESGNSMYDSRDNSNAIIETSTNTLIAGCQNTVIPNSVTSIGYKAFLGCRSLTSVTIPNSVISIGIEAFWNCSSLTSVTIGNSVTSIESRAFYQCRSLTSITIPSSVTSIGDFAFYECSSLTSVTCEAASAPALGNSAFFEVDKSIPLYVPSGSTAAYQAASGWSEFTNIQAIPSNGGSPLFPGDPGTLTLNLELKAAVLDGDELSDYVPTGAGGYPQGSEVTVTAQDIPGYQFVQWSDSVTDQSRTVVLNESMILTALYSRSMIEIAVAANQWTFICLPPLGDTQYTQDMFTYDGLNEVKWGTYNGATRASGKSGWVTPETFNALQGYIIYSTTAGTLRINAYQDEIRQGESADNGIYATIAEYSAPHPENAGWNFLGNPYAQGFDISAFADAGIEAPITVWNGTGYDTYTPGIDSYILKPFEAFFIQKPEDGTEAIPFNRE